MKLLRFRCSTVEDDSLISLAKYVESMSEGQDVIYYILSDSLTAAKNSPHMDYFKQHNIPVLFMTDALDGFMLTTLQEFDGHKLQNVDTAELDDADSAEAAEEAKSKLPDDQFAEVLTRFKSVLGERVEDVREAHHLSSSPTRLVAPDGAQGPEMDRIRRLLDQDYEVPKRVLELNRGHAIIQNIARLLKSNLTLADTLIEQLFDSALLSEGLHPNPADMLPRIQQLMEQVSKRIGQIREK